MSFFAFTDGNLGTARTLRTTKVSSPKGKVGVTEQMDKLPIED
jgi:hypothetical protein